MEDNDGRIRKIYKKNWFGVRRDKMTFAFLLEFSFKKVSKFFLNIFILYDNIVEGVKI